MSESFSRKDLLAFLTYLSDKGLAKQNTGQGLRVAVTKILTDLSPDEDADVRKVNVSMAVRRFHNKNPSALAPASLGVYETRVNSAISEFVLYRRDPSTYMGYKGGSRIPSSKNEKPAKTPKHKQEQDDGSRSSAASLPGVTSGLVHSFPLRQDFIAQVVLPLDLRAEEAKRLCAFVSALAVDFGAS